MVQFNSTALLAKKHNAHQIGGQLRSIINAFSLSHDHFAQVSFAVTIKIFFISIKSSIAGYSLCQKKIQRRKTCGKQ